MSVEKKLRDQAKTKKEWDKLKFEHKLGDAPISEEYRFQMQALAGVIDEFFNGKKTRGNDRKTGFVLMVFPFGDVAGRTNYISNGADRRDVVALMKEMIARFEGQPEMEGHA